MHQTLPATPTDRSVPADGVTLRRPLVELAVERASLAVEVGSRG
jgi:hypothetical protein